VVSKINNLLISSPYYRASNVAGKDSNDFNRITEGLDDLINTLIVNIFFPLNNLHLQDKEKEVKNKTKEVDAKRQHYSIIEKELAVIKQKYQQRIANPDIEIINPPNSNKDKENLLWASGTKSKRGGIHDSHEKRAGSLFSSGNKRSFDDLNTTSMMSSSRTTANGNRSKSGRIDLKASFGNIRDTNAQPPNLSDFLKTNLIVIDDGDEETESPQEEIKKKIKSGN